MSVTQNNVSPALRHFFCALLALALCLVAGAVRAAPDTNAPASDEIITNLAQFWQVASDAVERGRWHPARMEFLIYYCDTNWNVYWGRCEEVDGWLPLRELPQKLRSGQRVLLDGFVLPVNQQFSWAKTSIQILSESNRLAAIPAQGRLSNADELKDKFIEIEALVDDVQPLSGSVLGMKLLAEHHQLDACVHLDNPSDTLPNWVGKIARVRGSFAVTLDAFGKVIGAELWIPSPREVAIVSSLADDVRFSLPLVSSEALPKADANTLIHVAGMVRSQQPGTAVTIWDDSGQIRVLSEQRQPLQVGDYIEAIGYPYFEGYDRTLRQGLFRLTTHAPAAAAAATNQLRLHLADQVRSLDQETLALHPRARLEGEVTCVMKNMAFLQDSSGGIRIRATKLESGQSVAPGMLVSVEGDAVAGKFTPEITNAVVRQTGSMTLPQAPLVSFEQAMTGTEDGHWIQLRGYVRNVKFGGNSAELHMVAPAGEFVARIAPSDAKPSPQGSIVLVRGVCVATANARRQLKGIEIWSSASGALQNEQSAPDDLFAEPLRPIASLRQFNPFNTLNKRVHTRGVVTLQFPGRSLFLQDGDTTLLALSSQTNALQPGDQVEVVGFSGNNGGNFILREAVYRRVGAATNLEPRELTDLQSISDDSDGMLVRVEGVLLETANRPGKSRLILQANGRVVEALFEGNAALAAINWLPGSTLAATGVYRIQRDESSKALTFFLSLRNAGDVRLLAPPPWWTSRRLLFVILAGLPVFLLAVVWGLHTRRKNRLLETAQVELKAARDQLEERVKERTRELHEESEGRQRALTRLSEAQQRLIVASRQAGMAEVATGVLHNIGNILNSINISATQMGDALQRLRIGKFSEAAQLMAEQNGNLPEFFKDDPRGRALPGYLQQLAGTMAKHEQALNSEFKSLVKQIDHVKAVVVWQQDHARSSGVAEELEPAELMEDALQINRAAYERHKIELVRDYQKIPQFNADRHKILQILINLLSNAKYALQDSAVKKVTVRLRGDGPRLRFEIADTGVGIPTENLERIFSLGFTTRPQGHGFGLHSGANAAKEMGGHLFATSDGPGCGATFVLELPLTQNAH